MSYESDRDELVRLSLEGNRAQRRRARRLLKPTFVDPAAAKRTWTEADQRRQSR